jgi:hypothetical protein
VLVAGAATRPHYGGTLRVEMREAFESPEAVAPPAGFVLASWEAGRRALYTADESAAGGRPYLDSIEIQMGRPLRDQSTDLELGKADVVELGPNELRRQIAGRKVWSSSPVRLMALVFGPRVEDERVREALALAVDRGAIHSVLLQRQGEISGALLPQWLSGDAFLFAPAFDGARARSLATALAAPARTISLAVSDASLRPIADRIALNARDAGIIDEDVDRAHALFRRTHQALDIGGQRNVRLHADAGPAQRGDLLFDSLRLRLAPQIVDNHSGARLRQPDRNRPPDSAARTGYQRGSSVQRFHPHKLLVCTLRSNPRRMRWLQSPKGWSVVR